MFAIHAHRNAAPRPLFRRALARSITLAVVLVTLTATVSAQQYKTSQPKIQDRAAKTLKSQASKAMRNAAAFGAGGKESIDRYYRTYYFPKMTQTDPSALARLGKDREDLIKQLRGSTVPAAQEHLTQLARGGMRVLSRGNYHPAVRYNAVLILGLLDQQYAGGRVKAKPIVLSEATNGLLELLETNEFKGVKVHPSVKVGALEGLERHARFGIDAQYADRVTQASLAMLAQKPSDVDVDADVNNWMKCQAARVLVQQFKTGPSKEVHGALTQMIADDNMSLEDRCCVAGLLGKMTFPGEADVAVTLVPLGMLTQAVVAEGAEKAQEFEDLILGNNPSGRRRSYSRDEEGPKLERRQLLSRLASINKGATSLTAGLNDEEKQKLQGLTDLLLPVMKASGSPKELDLEVTAKVIQLSDTIADLVANWQPAAAVVEAAKPDFDE